MFCALLRHPAGHLPDLPLRARSPFRAPASQPGARPLGGGAGFPGGVHFLSRPGCSDARRSIRRSDWPLVPSSRRPLFPACTPPCCDGNGPVPSQVMTGLVAGFAVGLAGELEVGLVASPRLRRGRRSGCGRRLPDHVQHCYKAKNYRCRRDSFHCGSPTGQFKCNLSADEGAWRPIAPAEGPRKLPIGPRASGNAPLFADDNSTNGRAEQYYLRTRAKCLHSQCQANTFKWQVEYSDLLCRRP